MMNEDWILLIYWVQGGLAAGSFILLCLGSRGPRQ
jgi:hypothetical protein